MNEDADQQGVKLTAVLRKRLASPFLSLVVSHAQSQHTNILTSRGIHEACLKMNDKNLNRVLS